MTKPTDIDKNVTAASRRRFLREGGALLGGAVIAGGLAGSEAPRRRAQMPTTSRPTFRNG